MTKVIVSTRKWSSWPDFAGATWVPIQWVVGLRRLGVESYWVDHLRRSDPVRDVHSLTYLMSRFERTAQEFGFGDGYCVVYNAGERYYGMSEEQFLRLAGDADLLLSIGSKQLPAQSPLLRIPRRAYLDVDPGFTQIWAHQVEMGFYQHNLFFTVGQNIGRSGFTIPTQGIEWQQILPPVVLDLWPAHIDEHYERFSTVGDWWGKQHALYESQLYGGKREEFLRFLRLPIEAQQRLEPALCISQQDHKELGLLTRNNWRILDPYLYAGDPHSYREFIQHSRAEFSVAKGGYVKSNSGWVSDRTACYLASGKPALVQSTGQEAALPTGKGLLTFRTLEEAVAGIASINSDYLAHCHAARQLAETYFDSNIVLSSVLDRAGL